MSDLKEKIRAKMDEPTIANLATITEDGKPWVRYVTVRADEDLNIWVSTFVNSRKAAQIAKNPEVHLSTGFTTMETTESYIQVQGRAEVSTDERLKKEKWYPELEDIFSGPDDPLYAVIKIAPYRVEFQQMGPMPPEIWEP